MSDASQLNHSTGAIQDALPGFATALDEAAMKGHLQAALFGDCSSYAVERCTPTRPLYIPGECCILRYQVEARNTASGEVLQPIVTGRIFPDQTTCSAYMRDNLAPVAARMDGRPEIAAFAAPAAMIESLYMVVHVWPIDGELPSLVDASDRQRMIEVFRQTLPDTLHQKFVVDDCDIEMVSYRRRQRCVLRYTITGRTAASDAVRRLILYGKVTAAGNEPLTSRMIEALRDHLRQRDATDRFTVPRSFGCRPDLQLSLLEALPGQPHMGPALKARVRGKPPPPDARPLEEMIATSGYVAARLHTSGIELGRPHTPDDELSGVRREIATIRQFVPEFADEAQSRLERLAAFARHSETLPLCLCHGDFKYEQLLFDDERSGLVDFDTLCQAEPALDLGKFIADLRVQSRKMQKRVAVPPALVAELVEQFLHNYLATAGKQLEDAPHLRVRAALYETIALLRLALRSQQNLKGIDLEITTALLAERMAAAGIG